MRSRILSTSWAASTLTCSNAVLKSITRQSIAAQPLCRSPGVFEASQPSQGEGGLYRVVSRGAGGNSALFQQRAANPLPHRGPAVHQVQADEHQNGADRATQDGLIEGGDR